ncbi:hypothetical protein ACH4FE_23305 [Streptomyces celluloflavus]|uniref:hypothetical protein n=1 Tax=Streptomyces celluloflavus TaxID=58344 RepID=UPI0037999576
MATEDLSAAPSAGAPAAAAVPAPAHPAAAPGYGKRSAPDQRPRRPADFAHLPPREASIAAYLDRLPEGADIAVKTLAKVLPDYGQCALRTALRHLSEAGHLRRITEIRGGTGGTGGTGSPRWVTRTHFSRTARDDIWWAAFSTGDVPKEPEREPEQERERKRGRERSREREPKPGPGPEPEPESGPEPESEPGPESEPKPGPRPGSEPGAGAGAGADPEPQPPRPAPPRKTGPPPPVRSAAYAALAALGRAEPRLTLSAAECAALEELAAQWFARGATEAQLHRALTAGLPSEVHHPGGMARSRLVSKLPPEPERTEPEPAGTEQAAPHRRSAPSPLRIMECTVCRAPGRPEALPGGLCAPCRGETPPARAASGPTPAAIRAHVRHLRDAARTPERSRA